MIAPAAPPPDPAAGSAGVRPLEPAPSGRLRSTGAAAVLVATGILFSRILGVVRESLKARYLGATEGIAADAFNAAFRIPNLLQMLFGEGSLSASFIPVYSKLLALRDEEEAGRVAGAVFALLALVTSVLVLLGVLLAPAILFTIGPGFHGAKRELTIALIRVLFPGAGLFVLSAWCLGVLNSHRRFFLSYTAPVLWNVAMIGALLLFGRRRSGPELVILLAWASVIGAALQFLVQVPAVLRLIPKLRVAVDARRPTVRTVVRNFVPVFFSRGVVQISAYVDQLLSTFLPNGMVSVLFYGQTVSVLPVSLFGMSVSAAELPEMSSTLGNAAEVAAVLRGRLDRGLRRIAYFVVPSATAFLLLGDVIVAALFQRGRFSSLDTVFTWGVLAGASVGLLASTLGRLYSSTYYALHDTRTPLRFAVVRVTLTSVFGYVFAFHGPALLGVDSRWGAAGLTASAGLAGWVEFSLLRSRMNRRIGRTGLAARYVAALWGAALPAGLVAFALKLLLGYRLRSHIATAVVVLGAFGVLYAGLTLWLRIPEARDTLGSVRARFGGRGQAPIPPAP